MKTGRILTTALTLVLSACGGSADRASLFAVKRDGTAPALLAVFDDRDKNTNMANCRLAAASLAKQRPAEIDPSGKVPTDYVCTVGIGPYST